MAYLDNSGLSYFWSKIKALFGKLKITIGGPNSVGTAKAGTAKTVVSTYTPSGDIRIDTVTTTVDSLIYEYKNYKLYIYGIAIPIVSGATFDGNGVTLNVEQEN